MNYKLGSLFDGSGGFPLAGTLCGIEPVWAAEVEPYPIAVTRERFPKMKHLGDIRKVNGADIEPVDIITFGSPCQDLSVAGKRAGLKHEANGDEETTRSGLFMDAVRIIKEMRKATNGMYPRFALWENVPGAFSSNHGEDFRTVLEELIKIVEPTASMPAVPQKGWNYADSYIGDGWSLAYRVFDAQYWGVPQRRRRIHLVADFRGTSAREILFERKGVRGYFTQGRTPWQAAPGNASDRTGTASLCLNDQGGQRMPDKDNLNCVIQPFGICSKDSNAMKSDNPHSGIYEAETARTLDGNGGNPSCNQGGIAVVESIAYDARGNGDGKTVNTLTGDHENRVTDYTSVVVYDGANVTSPVNASNPEPRCPCHTHRPAVAYGLDRASFNQGQNAKFDFTVAEEQQPTMTARGPGSVCCTTGSFTQATEEIAPTLMARDWKDPTVACTQHYIVRRLTPTECARLQGFADCWGDIEPKDDFTDDEYQFWLNVRNTHAAINGKTVKEYTKAQMMTWYNKLHTDSSEYKMWGNGIALPPALYCMQGITDVLNAQED